MQVPDINTLSPAQKIGQLFFVGIPADHVEAVTANIMSVVEPGGICLFARNIKSPEQVRGLLDEIRELSGVEPFLSIDQEGGLVDRLRRILGPMPAASKIVTAEGAAVQAEIIGRALRTLGFNMDFAPVVDVVDTDRSVFSNGLHSRAYGSSAAEATEIAAAFLNTLQANRVIGCIKHFPGLGASEVDSHEELPTVGISEQDFRAVDLHPFQHLINSGTVRAVMVAHAAYPGLDLQETDRDGKLLPSSLSFNFVTKLLRNELGFEGLVVTDDLEMGAIVKNYGVAEAALRAIEAGNDMVAICAGVDSILEAHGIISAAAASGRLDTSALDLAVGRILSLKKQLSTPDELDLGQIASVSQKIVELNGTLS